MLKALDFKVLRKMTGLSQKEFAEKSGLSYSYVTKIEQGIRTLLPWVDSTIRVKFKKEYDELMDSKK